MAKSNYGQIKKYENEILAMKEAGYTKRRIAEEFPKIKVQISTPIHSLLFFKDGYYPPNSYDYDSDSNNDSYWLCIFFLSFPFREFFKKFWKHWNNSAFLMPYIVEGYFKTIGGDAYGEAEEPEGFHCGAAR